MTALPALRMLLTRGRIALSVLNPKRTLVQINGLTNEVKASIELMLPYGMSALPPQGDVIMLQIGASRSHLVALCADDPSLRIADLQQGEFGFMDTNGQKVVFRQNQLELITPLNLVVTVTGNVTQTVNGNLDQTVQGTTTLTCNDIQLGGTGGEKIARNGDQVKNGGTVVGEVVASSTTTTSL